VLKGEFQRANVKRTKCSEVLKGKLLTIQAVRAIETSPEKAGVGGSTPSLATIFSITWLRHKPQGLFHSVPKFQIQACRSLPRILGNFSFEFSLSLRLAEVGGISCESCG
jgi:hypothetical protein